MKISSTLHDRVVDRHSQLAVYRDLLIAQIHSMARENYQTDFYVRLFRKLAKKGGRKAYKSLSPAEYRAFTVSSQ